MTHVEYLERFERHLRVGGKNRASILAELRAHIDQLDTTADPQRTLGDPRVLARAYTITHLGYWRGVTWMFITPFVAWWLILQSWGRWHNGWFPEEDSSIGLVRWWHSVGQEWIPLFIACFLGWFVVHQLSRLVRPWKIYGMLLLLAFSIGTVFFSSMDYGSRSKFVDLSRAELDQTAIISRPDGFTGGPVFRDRQTGFIIPEDQMENYFAPVSVWSAIIPAASMNAIIVGMFAIFSGMYIGVAQLWRQPPTKKKPV